jgi:hypothetical protein
MLRMIIPPILLAIFIGWIVYRAFIRKDLRNHMTELYAGLFFIAVWAVIYFVAF